MVEMSRVKLVRNNELLQAPVGVDESVMLDTEAGQYFGLNPVGTYIWLQLEQPRSVAELQAAVCAEFEVDSEGCEADIVAFVDSLIANGIVHESPA